MDAAPELAIRCWAGFYRNRWLVVRVGDRSILTTGSVEHCLRWVRVYGTTSAARASGSPLAANCRM